MKTREEQLEELLRDTLDNLRLMRQYQRLDGKTQTRVVVDGYELFERAQALGVSSHS